jgi:hypothetical protein
VLIMAREQWCISFKKSCLSVISSVPVPIGNSLSNEVWNGSRGDGFSSAFAAFPIQSRRRDIAPAKGADKWLYQSGKGFEPSYRKTAQSFPPSAKRRVTRGIFQMRNKILLDN